MPSSPTAAAAAELDASAASEVSAALQSARSKHIRSHRPTDARALWEVGSTLVVQLALFALHPRRRMSWFRPSVCDPGHRHRPAAVEAQQ